MADDRFGARPRPQGPGGFTPRNNDAGGFTPRNNDAPGGDRNGFERPRFPRAGGPPPSAMSGPPHFIRLRSGDIEIEVSGTAPFVRQTIDDLPILLARVRGEVPPRPNAISMPTTSLRDAAPEATAQAVPVPALPAAHATPAVTATRTASARSATPAVPERRGPGRPRKDATAVPAKTTTRVRTHAPAQARVGEPIGDLEREILAVIRHAGRPVPVAEIREQLRDDVSAQLVRRTLERSSRVVATSERPASYTVR